MIPKIIHFCWFGKGEMPELAVNCMKSWKKYLPNYEIIKWDEESFDISQFDYCKEAYALKKYAFVSDVCRLYALKLYGGIYLDTDIEILKPLDPFLNNAAFLGFEGNYLLGSGIIGSEANGEWVSSMLSYYDNKHFINDNGTAILTTNVSIISDLMKKNGFALNNNYQYREGYITLYPEDYLSPKNFFTGKIEITHNTYCIHHFNASWLDNKAKFKIFIIRIIAKIFGNKIAYLLLNLYKKLNKRK